MHVWQFATLSWNFGETAKEVVRVGKKSLRLVNPVIFDSHHNAFFLKCVGSY